MVDIDAERIAEALKPSGSRVAARNRLIKKALGKEFGYSNVKVKGDRGTAYGWVTIRIMAERPHNGECDWSCPICSDFAYEIKRKVWQILKDTGLDKEIGTYYSDAGEERKECIIEVRFK